MSTLRQAGLALAVVAFASALPRATLWAQTTITLSAPSATLTMSGTTSVAQGTPVVQAAPAVGAEAPNFVAAWGDSAGIKATPLVLHDLRGRVVVLAFYPGDRTSGCTVEMSRFRDNYKTIFGANDVVVLPVSVDSVETHVAWAKEMHFPFSLVSDRGSKIAALYGSVMPGKSYNSRTVFVIGKDGKIVYSNLHFNALDGQSYDDLAAAVRKAAGA